MLVHVEMEIHWPIFKVTGGIEGRINLVFKNKSLAVFTLLCQNICVEKAIIRIAIEDAQMEDSSYWKAKSPKKQHIHRVKS